MKITVTKDFRGLKAGWEYKFPLREHGSCTIVGENGCGKSSLLQALRGKIKEKSASLYRDEFNDLSNNIDIEHDYERILFLDAVKDNGTDYMNAYDAVGLVNSGGFQAGKLGA